MKRIDAFFVCAASLALAAGVVGLAACSTIVGITDLPTGEGGTAASIPSGVYDPTQFVGTWTVTTGSNIVSCPGAQPETTADQGTLVIQRGQTSDIVSTQGTCVLGANLSAATTATILPNQTCTEAAPDGTGQITVAPSGTFSINAAGTSGVVTFSGSATDVDRGETVTCSFTQTDEYAKN